MVVQGCFISGGIHSLPPCDGSFDRHAPLGLCPIVVGWHLPGMGPLIPQRHVPFLFIRPRELRERVVGSKDALKDVVGKRRYRSSPQSNLDNPVFLLHWTCGMMRIEE